MKSSCVTDPLLRGGHSWKLSRLIECIFHHFSTTHNLQALLLREKRITEGWLNPANVMSHNSCNFQALLLREQRISRKALVKTRAYHLPVAMDQVQNQLRRRRQLQKKLLGGRQAFQKHTIRDEHMQCQPIVSLESCTRSCGLRIIVCSAGSCVLGSCVPRSRRLSARGRFRAQSACSC